MEMNSHGVINVLVPLPSPSHFINALSCDEKCFLGSSVLGVTEKGSVTKKSLRTTDLTSHTGEGY